MHASIYIIGMLKYLDETSIGDNLLWFHNIYKGLFQRHSLYTAHVESINTVPPCSAWVSVLTNYKTLR